MTGPIRRITSDDRRPYVVIVGGGFGGTHAAHTLRHAPARVTVIDRTNHSVFHPLLYQVATAVLSPGEIAQPIRRILNHAKNVEVILAEVTGFDKEKQLVKLADGSGLGFDYLIVAAGARQRFVLPRRSCFVRHAIDGLLLAWPAWQP